MNVNLFLLQVQEKFPKVAVLDPRKGERAVLVKDYQGDYAIIIGRWAVYRNRREMTTACECLTWEYRNTSHCFIYWNMLHIAFPKK